MSVFAYIGFDIGLTGAVAVLNEQEVPLIFDIPVVRSEKDAFIDSRDLALSLRHVLKPDACITAMIEDIQPRPNSTKAGGKVRQTSIKTEGSLMRSRGHIECLCALMKYKLQACRPQAWKKHFGLTGQDKEASLVLARKLFPDAAHELRLAKHHNRAESLLIALYCKRLNQ